MSETALLVPMTEKKRIESLQVLRGLAFLGIFTSHCGNSSLGPWAVSVFFVMSGFLMTLSYYQKKVDVSFTSAFGFSVLKISKLYNLHILTMIADLMVPCIFYGKNVLHLMKTQFTDIILNVLLIQSWFYSDTKYFSMNAVAWFLSDMFFVYLCFPVVLSSIKKTGMVVKAFFYVAGVFFSQIVVACGAYILRIPGIGPEDFVKYVTYICPLYRLGDFIAGAFMGYIYIYI